MEDMMRSKRQPVAEAWTALPAVPAPRAAHALSLDDELKMSLSQDGRQPLAAGVAGSHAASSGRAQPEWSAALIEQLSRVQRLSQVPEPVVDAWC